STVAATRRSQSSSALTSARTATAVPPVARISSTVAWIEPGHSSDPDSLRPETTTAAPSAASCSATALPMPLAAPVTMATRPASGSFIACAPAGSPVGRDAGARGDRVHRAEVDVDEPVGERQRVRLARLRLQLDVRLAAVEPGRLEVGQRLGG